LRVIEESSLNGNILVAFNATFIALIPKDDISISFEEYRLISLYNYIYKIITKSLQEGSILYNFL
jgi:hypothetical protein